ncbi:MAG: DUF3137 domain-containing protein [Pseudomonadota bacterium]
MKTLRELKSLYETAMLPDLDVLERERRQVVKKIIYAGLGIFGVVILVIAVFYTRVDDRVPLFIFPGFAGVAILIGVGHLLSKDYVEAFKGKILRRIVSFFDENLTYDASGCISQSRFEGCRIFTRRPDRYTGDDLVQGKLGATQIQFSEIHAEEKSEHTDSKGNRRTEWHTIFRGLFFVADFNKNFNGRTVVLPDTAERIFGHIGTMFQSWNVSRGELIKLEDIEFENIFAVYGDDQIEARYILTTSLMKRIVDFKKKSDRPIHLSFVGSKIYVAISYKRSLFEPRVFRTILDFEPIREYFEDLALAVGLVEDLNLNTRIWSKQDPGRPAEDAKPEMTASDWSKRGGNFLKIGKYQKAIDAYDRALVISGQNASVYFNRGVAYNKIRNNIKGLNDMKAAAGLGHKTARQILKKKGVDW